MKRYLSNKAIYSATPLKGMSALVTGGGRGIGAAICRGLTSAGASVAIVDIQPDAAHDLLDEIISKGGKAICITADISRETECADIVKKCVAELGGLDILINCAAPPRDRSMLGKLIDVDWEIHHRTVLGAALSLTNAALAPLGASGNGSVINISSITGAAIAIDQCAWPYHVTKAGLDQLTRWLAVKLGASGVRVNAVAPGLIDRDYGSKLTDDTGSRAVVETVVPLGRAGTGDDIANTVIFLASRQSAYITGQVLTVDGGLSINEVFGASLRAYKANGEFAK